jgi:hypothetical protein
MVKGQPSKASEPERRAAAWRPSSEHVVGLIEDGEHGVLIIEFKA